MSFFALAWAGQTRVPRASDKLILLAYATCHNEESGNAYPSINWLSEWSSLDRKTVIASVARLEAAGLLVDTGRRVGATKQVKVYQLQLTDLTVPKTALLKTANSPVFSSEQSQKRDTEPVREPFSPNGEIDKRAGADGFDVLWPVFPLRVGKRTAQAAYDRAVVRLRKAGDPDPAGTILAGLTRLLPFWTDPEFIPHPSTWINRDGWHDEPRPRTERTINDQRPVNNRAASRSVWNDIASDGSGPGPASASEPRRLEG